MISDNVLEKLEFEKILHYISKYSITEKGKSLIYLLKPFNSLAGSKNEGDLVTEAKEIMIKNNFPPLEFIPDLEITLSTSAIEGAVIDSKKILEILKLVVISRNLTHYFKNNSETAPLLNEIGGRLFKDKLFENFIQRIVNENGEIRDSASSKLAEIRRDIRSKNDELIRSVNRIIKSLNEKDIVREDYLTLRDGRIVIPVKSEHKRHIRGFIHSESSTGQTVYIEPEETLELNNDIVSLSFAERREIERLLRELTKRIGELSSQLKESLEIISYIDSIFARANYSIEIIGAFPLIDNKKPYLISDARHPIILKKLGRENTVPLNINVRDKKIVLITGPNAGGKTVVLKTIGLLSLMIQSGIHIPASPDSNFHFFKNILLDVGDSQSIEDDLSTFSSHLSNINKILYLADSDSLILLDEIGTGTDPAEGSALATAMLITIRDKRASAFATTHHGSLKLIANDLEGFENAAMEFDTHNLKPTYVFKQGVPGSSYAFEVAKRIGLPDKFLELASNYLDSSKHKIENFLVEIERKSQQLNDKLKNAELESTRLTGLSILYRQNIDKLDNERREILKKTKIEAEEYLKGINRKIENVIKGIKESNAENKIIKESQKIIKEIKENNKEFLKEDIELREQNYNFEVGSIVAVKDTQSVGKILELSKDKMKATVTFGSVKMQVALKNLVHSEENKKSVNILFHSPQVEMPQQRLDIRGERPEEAEFEIIKFIDNAYSSGLGRIEILHGKGTGVLKRTVQDILKSHDRVKTYYFAPIQFGGDGITIAELN
ncbi:MAG: endonuclease MutS2 [Ignavibacteriaceae bacterium]